MFSLKDKTTNKFNFRKSSFLIKILCCLIIGFIAIQLYVLTVVGPQGEKLSDIRKQQSEIKIQNEIARAKILDLQSNPQILHTISEKLQLEPAKLTFLDPNQPPVAAQNP
jgi:cell division protein FtsI/penicillin-binding protein 2